MSYDAVRAIPGKAQGDSAWLSDADVLRVHKPVNAALKRIFDIAASLSLILLTLPLMLAIAGIIAVKDGMPILFGHIRIGKDGEPFVCWKFRTMTRDADAQLKALLARDPAARQEWASNRKLREDPRIIPWIGSFLRKSSLDELPQLFNVLVGEMSMVGPRPVVVDELERYYGSTTGLYKSVRPGITGPWQIGDRSNDSYEARVAKDAAYIQKWSLREDVRIVLMTALVVVHRKGAY
ncbi:MAG: sugar transferase [Pseudomonadota bacterium]